MDLAARVVNYARITPHGLGLQREFDAAAQMYPRNEKHCAWLPEI